MEKRQEKAAPINPLDEYYNLYWGTGREKGACVLYFDKIDLGKTLALIGNNVEIRLIGNNLAKLQPYTEYNTAKSLKGFLRKNRLRLNKFTIENKDGVIFTGQHQSELLITIPQNLSSDLVVARYMSRLERSWAYIALSCNKNAMIKVDGGRIQRIQPMTVKEFDGFWVSDKKPV